MWMETVFYNLKCYPSICLQGRRTNQKKWELLLLQSRFKTCTFQIQARSI